MNKLILNENEKVWRQTALRVIAIIILVFIMLSVPAEFLLNRVLTPLMYSEESLEDEYRWALENAGYYNERVAELSGSEYYEGRESDIIYFETSALEASYRAESIKFFIDNGMTAYDWKYNLFGEDYLNTYIGLKTVELIRDGKYSSGEINIDSALSRYLMNSSYTGDTKEELDTAYKDMSGRLSTLRAQILNMTFSEWLVTIRDEQLELARFNQGSAEEYEKELKLIPGDEELIYNRDVFRSQAEANQLLADYYDKLIAQNVEYDSWQYSTVSIALTNALNEETVIIPQKLYESTAMQENQNTPYETYAKQFNKKLKSHNEALEIILYSLDNDIPTPSSLDASAKSRWQSGIASSVSTIQIFLVVLAGMIVANEFSSGTIRLLLIRPKKRSKILTSKLLCVVEWAVGMMLFSAVILFIMNLVFVGVTDMFVPDLRFAFGRVVELPGVFVALEYLVFAAIPALFVTSLAFLFSSWIQKAALSIALPLIIHSVMSTASAILSSLRDYLPAIDLTIFPYYNMTIFVTDPLENYFMPYFFGSYNSTEGLYPLVGVIIFVILTALPVAFSYLAFTRKQIKS